PDADDPSEAFRQAFRAARLSLRKFSAGVGVDHGFVARVVRGEKKASQELLDRAKHFLAKKNCPPPPGKKALATAGTDALAAALAYRKLGFSVVPQRPGAKHPAVKWKPFQTRRPTEVEIRYWFKLWPDAGLAVVLGAVSSLFAIDVDGEEAHDVLVARLGGEPLAPKVMSGSGDPRRYHLYFRCPELPTKAKQTPWHPKLEFRGERGIVILPPS